MRYRILKDVISLLEQFEEETTSEQVGPADFLNWLRRDDSVENVPNWEGKDKGRSEDSVINTQLVHLGRYAKNYARAAIHQSPLSTPDEFIYLITLNVFGEMSKIGLIKKNVHDKPAGIQIINRLIKHGWVHQRDSEQDRRSKLIGITPKGREVLESCMHDIRIASGIVTGNLTMEEKHLLIGLLNKLDDFHQQVISADVHISELLAHAHNLKVTNTAV